MMPNLSLLFWDLRFFPINRHTTLLSSLLSSYLLQQDKSLLMLLVLFLLFPGSLTSSATEWWSLMSASLSSLFVYCHHIFWPVIVSMIVVAALFVIGSKENDWRKGWCTPSCCHHDKADIAGYYSATTVAAS
jgi:hypothetical protein